MLESVNCFRNYLTKLHKFKSVRLEYGERTAINFDISRNSIQKVTGGEPYTVRSIHQSSRLILKALGMASFITLFKLNKL